MPLKFSIIFPAGWGDHGAPGFSETRAGLVGSTELTAEGPTSILERRSAFGRSAPQRYLIYLRRIANASNVACRGPRTVSAPTIKRSITDLGGGSSRRSV